MRAMIVEAFGAAPEVRHVKEPEVSAEAVVVEVKATGLCRSDWHGWMGHDPDIALPHVPGHEYAGVVVEVGHDVNRVRVGDRVTAPFVLACGRCHECRSGQHQVCERQSQPGFTHWGSFAERVVVDHADGNVVALPDSISFTTAASLGCRFATSFRAVVDQGRVRGGEWVAVHGCGGVGLSAIMIAVAMGAQVVAIDVAEPRLTLAKDLGATVAIRSRPGLDVAQAIRDVTHGGAHLSFDAVGSSEVCIASISCLRRRGRHVQVGLLLADQAAPSIPMARVIAYELEILGSHGMQAWRYDALLSLITSGRLTPERLVGRLISLDEAAIALTRMDRIDRDQAAGIAVVDRFG